MEITAAALWLNTAFAAFDQSITLLVHQLYGLAGGLSLIHISEPTRPY